MSFETSSYQPRHSRESSLHYKQLVLFAAQVVSGRQNDAPQHKKEQISRHTSQPRGVRTIAGLALGIGLTVSFNGAQEVAEPATVYVDRDVVCRPQGYQRVAVPVNLPHDIDALYADVRLKQGLRAADCTDEFYEYVSSQITPQFAMDAELGFAQPATMLVPRAYVDRS